MFPNERHKYILNKLKKNNSVIVSELMTELEVSIETIRRDLFTLEKNGELKRVHGGAISIARTNDFPMLEKRISRFISEKTEVCKKAMQFINEGDIIAIDSGSTAIIFANLLKEHFKSLTVISHSLEVLNILSECENYKIICCGGMYLKEEKSFYGSLALGGLNKTHFGKAFVFVSAISLKNGVQDFSYELIDMQKTLLENADEVFILADSSKLEKNASIRIASLLPSYTIITDGNVSDTLKRLYQENNIKLI